MRSHTSTKPLNAVLQWWQRLGDGGSGYSSKVMIEACVIGSLSAAAAFVFNAGVLWLGALRAQLCLLAPPWLVLPLVGLVGGTICGCFISFIAPEITGSGIPQVKAFLRGMPMRLDLRVAVSKLLSGIVALGIGLPLGREGPTVQLGASVASVLGGVGYQSPRHRRQLIAAGAGAGLAAAFNAPLAGVIFIIEELLKEVTSLATGAALVACFFAGVVSRWLGNHNIDVPPSSIFPSASFYVHDVPFCLLVGILAGLLGSVFNNSIIATCKLNDRVLKDNFVVRVAVAGLVCGVVIAVLPETFRNFAGIRELIFSSRSWHFALVALIANFALTVLAYGAGTPGGLFAPSLTIGCALGFFVGLADMLVFPAATQSPITLALVGMGAFFSGVARVPITATVIVFEMTTDFNLLLPLMISAITAYIVGERIAPGSVYDRLLAMKGAQLSEAPNNDPLAAVTVSQVMRGGEKIETLPAQATIEDALAQFAHSGHRGFPVIENGALVGIVTQTDVITRGNLLSGEQKTVQYVMTPNPVTVCGSDSLRTVVGLLDQYGLSRLPVVENNEVIGIITQTDVIKALAVH